MMMEDARGSRWKKPVWITGMTAASLTALFRVLAGEHFPTDVFAGALAGSAVAFLIFKAHE